MLCPSRRAARRGFFLLSIQFWVSAAIVGFFALMMALLWKREMGERYSVRGLGISPDFLTATWIDYEQYMWVEQAGERIGVYMLRIERDNALGTYELVLRSRLRLNVLGAMVPVWLDAWVLLDPDFVMETFQGELRAAGETISVEAFPEGLALYYRLQGPPALVPEGGLAARADLDRPVILADAVRPLVTQGRQLKVGNRWSTRASDPFSGKLDMVVSVEVVAEEAVEIGGQSVRAFRVLERTKDAATTSWYDVNGHVLRTDLGNGLVLVRADRDVVFDTYPALRVPPNFDDIDRDALIAQAAEQRLSDGADPLAWLPKL
jgi:hypothetical protein